MPLGPYATWDDCIADQLAQGKTQPQAERICGALERDTGKEKARMAKLKTRDIKGVEIFDIGTWNAQTGVVKVSDQDLVEMVENYAALKGQLDPPLKLGHDEDQELIQEDGYPAAGWIDNVRRKGTKLVADFKKVPEKVADLIDAGAYRKVSSEVWKSFTLAGKKYSNVLGAVALLGKELPAVTTLGDIVALYSGRLSVGIDGDSKVQVLIYEAKKADPEDEDDDEQETADLLTRLEELRARSSQATKGRRGAPAFRAWLDESVKKLRELVKTKAALGEDSPLEQRSTAVAQALRAQFGGWPGVVETFDDYAITDRDGRYWQVFYTIADGGAAVLGESVEVVRTWRPKNAGTPGKKEAVMADKTALAALGLPENADDAAVVAAIEGLKVEKDKFSAMPKRVEELELKLARREASDAVEGAIKARKLAPAQREWADQYALKDPEGFKTYVEKSPELFEEGERGHAGDAPEAQSDVTQFRAKVAEKVKAGMAVDEAQKQVSIEEPELYDAIRGRR